jgi:hypothetical protein
MKSPRANQTQVDNKILSLSGRNPSHGKILKNIADEMSVNKFTPKPHVFDHVVSQGPAFSRAIMNRNAPESAMEKVLNGGSVFGVDYVASHPNASNKLLRRIHDTTDSELVQAKVKDHPNFYKTSAEGENLEKAIKVGEVFVPDTEGEEHPEKKSLIEGKLSNGDMGWFLKPEIAKKKDDELWQLAAHNYGKFAPVKNLYSKMIGQVSKDPDRHAQVGDVRDAKGNKQIAVRSRHLLSALKGSEGCSLSHDGSKIYLTADRHSPNSPGVTSSWVFDENGFKNN